MSDIPKKLRVIDSPDPERPPLEPEPPRPKLRLGSKEITEVNRPMEATTKPIVVHEILAENLKKTVPAEKPMDLRQKMSRRKRDYWLCLIFGDALFIGGALLFRAEPIAFVSCIAGGGVYTVSITWVMWQVMGDY
jgi:hypothetical protein